MPIPQTLINLANKQATQFNLLLPNGEILPAAINPHQAATLDFRNGLLLPGNANPFAGTPLFEALENYLKQQKVNPQNQAELADRSTTLGETIANSFTKTKNISIEIKSEPFKFRFPYGKLAAYPHLGPNDEKIWNNFIEKFPGEYGGVDYDTRVGDGELIFSDGLSEAAIRDAILLSQKRIDAVAHPLGGGPAHVIEVKPHAGSSALGQVRVNTDLFIKDFGIEAVPVIITDRAQPDIFELAEKYGIKIIEVGFE